MAFIKDRDVRTKPFERETAQSSVKKLERFIHKGNAE